MHVPAQGQDILFLFGWSKHLLARRGGWPLFARAVSVFPCGRSGVRLPGATTEGSVSQAGLGGGVPCVPWERGPLDVALRGSGVNGRGGGGRGRAVVSPE
jgi:hypothetical protein